MVWRRKKKRQCTMTRLLKIPNLRKWRETTISINDIARHDWFCPVTCFSFAPFTVCAVAGYRHRGRLVCCTHPPKEGPEETRFACRWLVGLANIGGWRVSGGRGAMLSVEMEMGRRGKDWRDQMDEGELRTEGRYGVRHFENWNHWN